MYVTAYRQQMEDAIRLLAPTFDRPLNVAARAACIERSVRVSSTLQHHDYSTDVCTAGLLFFYTQAWNVDLGLIGNQCGTRVAGILAELTGHKTDAHNRPLPWPARKRKDILQLRQASPEAVAVKAADTLHEVRAIVFDIRLHGPSAWAWFTGKPCWMLYAYRAVAREALHRLPGHPLAHELAEAVEDLALLVAETGMGN